MPKFQETDDFVVDLREKKNPKEESSKIKTEKKSPSFEDRVVQSAPKQKQEPYRFFEPTEEKSEFSSQGWLNFIQYNNAFLVVVVVGIVAFAGLSFASEDVRENTIGSKQVYAEGTDNTILLEMNFDEFNMDYMITGISEDEESFTVTYSYIDFDIEDNAWQYIEKTGARKISKPFRKDLGLYLAGQLSQEANARIKELKKLQKQEQEKGQVKVVQVTKYSGLIGKVLDLGGTVFENYEPVKKIELQTPAVNTNIQRRASGAPDNLTNVYNEWVEENPDLVQDLDDNIVDEDLNNQEENVTDDESGDNKNNSEEDIDNEETEVLAEETKEEDVIEEELVEENISDVVSKPEVVPEPVVDPRVESVPEPVEQSAPESESTLNPESAPEVTE